MTLEELFKRILLSILLGVIVATCVTSWINMFTRTS